MAGAPSGGNRIEKTSGKRPAPGLCVQAGIGLLLLACVVLVRAEGPADPATGKTGPDPWAALQDRGAVISAIEIHVGDVFDLSDPTQNHWVGRVANVIHIRTRKRIIRRELLFKTGDMVNARLIHESERLLRSLEYVRDAQIHPRVNPGGTVTAVVLERDAWTLKGGIRFGRTGGQNTWRIRAHEVDFLGLGKQILISRQKDYERTTNQFSYGDPQVLGSRWQFFADYQQLSDGSGRYVSIKRPFYELTAPWAFHAIASASRSSLTFYDDAEAVYAAATKTDYLSLFGGRLLSWRNRTAIRAGVEYRVEQNSYGPLIRYLPSPALPEPDLSARRFRGPLLYLSLDQDRYKSYVNIRDISHTEDFNMGWDASASAGYFSRTLGSGANAWYGELKASKGIDAGPETFFLWNGYATARKEGGGWRNVLARSSLSLYNQSFPHQTLAANAFVSAGSRLDPEKILYLGGEYGLRGYPNHFKAGRSLWKLSFEERVVTPWRPWGIVQAGFVGFVDAASIRRFEGRGWSRVYADVGVGLRFGNLKSSFGRILMVAVAVPLVREPGVDNYQIVVGDVVNF